MVGKSTNYALNDIVYPTSPSVLPYYYKRLVTGTSSTTTVPTWTTTIGSQIDDNNYITNV